jgi:membrane-bound serine protease (ClpP class)
MIWKLFPLFTLLVMGGLGRPRPLLADDKVIPSVAVLTLTGVINPISADYISKGLEKAMQEKRAAVLIELDTPGGLLDATRALITSMINADIPVIVYVAPRGARATSAGTFIMMGSDIAAMAPETHIGAAHPIELGPGASKREPDSVMGEKMVSDSAAYIRTLAGEHRRNAAWAEQAVRESVSLTAEEALKQNVIEIVAGSREDLFAQLEGRRLTKNNRTWTLHLKNASPVPYEMSFVQSALQRIAHPNIAYILMTIGIYGLIYELAAPGIGLGGVAGAICLLLAFFALQILPINTVGLVFIVVGVVMLVLELLNPSHGLLMFGGLMAFAFGSFFLIDTGMSPAYGHVSLALIGGTVLTTGLLFGVALRKAFQARRAKPKTGVESMVGMRGVAQGDLSPTGMVAINGELWRAEAETPASDGAAVIIIRVEGNTLFVRKN